MSSEGVGVKVNVVLDGGLEEGVWLGFIGGIVDGGFMCCGGVEWNCVMLCVGGWVCVVIFFVCFLLFLYEVDIGIVGCVVSVLLLYIKSLLFFSFLGKLVG